MHNDSIETLLLRHYGHAAPVPQGLDDRLATAVRQQARELRQQQQIAARFHTQPLSRRRVVRLVTLGTAGLGVLSAGLEGLSGLAGQDAAQAVTP